MPRGGLRSTSYKPGVSGNPGGRPRQPQTIAARRIVADVKELAREYASEAISTLKIMMLDTKTPPAARLGAAIALLDRGYGKPRQEVSVDASYDLTKLSLEDLETLERILAPVAPIEHSQGGEGTVLTVDAAHLKSGPPLREGI